MSLAQPIRAKIDLESGIVVLPQHRPLMQDDANANRMIAALYIGDEPADIAAMSAGVGGMFFRSDGSKVPLEGEYSGNEASVIFNAHCYLLEGDFKATLHLTKGETKRTVMKVVGRIAHGGDGPTIDVEDIVPDVEEINALYEEMQQEKQEAQQAAQTAQQEAQTAQQAAQTAQQEAQAAQQAAQTAQQAQQTTQQAAQDAQEAAQEARETAEEVRIDANAYSIPVLEMTGDVSAMNKIDAVTLSYVYGDMSGTARVKWQGSSSIAYPKKNYTVTFDQSFEAKAGWGEHDKYVMKANWVDVSALRNVYGAVLWGQLIEDRAGLDARLAALPNKGAIDGFPIWITINGKSMGLYTFTIPKEGWLLGMTGENAAEGFVCAEVGTLAGPVVGDGTDFTVEYAAGDETALIASLNNMVSVVNSVASADDLAALESVIDVQSVIDYYVFMAFVHHGDGISKNYILGTYDGVKWFMSAYDMDGTFGNAWNGQGYGWPNDWPMFDDGSGGDYPLGINNLLDVVRKYYAPQIKARYQNARYWRLGEQSYLSELYKLAIEIPEMLMLEDMRLWPGRPGTHTNNLTQILNYMRVRGVALDWNVQSIT